MSKVAVVTGAGSGIGRRTVERLQNEGWITWSLDNSLTALEEHAAALPTDGRHHYQECDVSNAQSVAAAFSKIANGVDKIDALICSAGVFCISALEDMTPEQVDWLLGVNVRGPWLCVKAALALLREGASVDDPSRVVILGSIGGLRPKVGSGFYSATKAAVHVLTGVYAMELAGSGVIVNAVAPGSVATPQQPSAEAFKNSSYRPSGVSPLGRIGRPDDIADVILFFLSDSAKYVNGTVLPVDGGTRAAFQMK
jgi:NAD(P)-dependent dehydrogenase (short-subunit alcohol dehydrogenase family)